MKWIEILLAVKTGSVAVEQVISVSIICMEKSNINEHAKPMQPLLDFFFSWYL